MIFLSIESNMAYILKPWFMSKTIGNQILHDGLIHDEVKFWLLHHNINPYIVVNGDSKDTSRPSCMTGHYQDLFNQNYFRTGVSLSAVLSTACDMVRVLEQDIYFGFDKEEDATLFKLTWL